MPRVRVRCKECGWVGRSAHLHIAANQSYDPPSMRDHCDGPYELVKVSTITKAIEQADAA